MSVRVSEAVDAGTETDGYANTNGAYGNPVMPSPLRDTDVSMVLISIVKVVAAAYAEFLYVTVVAVPPAVGVIVQTTFTPVARVVTVTPRAVVADAHADVNVDWPAVVVPVSVLSLAVPENPVPMSVITYAATLVHLVSAVPPEPVHTAVEATSTDVSVGTPH